MLTLQTQPTRPSTWMLGDTGGVQVWAAYGHRAVLCAVLIGASAPIVTLNQAVVDTPSEMQALCWAFARIAEGAPGFYVQLV